MTLHFIKAALGIVCLICSALHALPIDLPEIPLVEDVPVVEDVPIVEDLVFIAKFLYKYGYIKTLVTELLNLEALAHPISVFQKFVGLNVTGTPNEETIAKMKAPRCGVKDIIDNAEDAIRRKKRYDAIVMWEKNNLTYRLKNVPYSIQDETQVRHEMTRGLKMWSDVSTLSFREVRATDESVDLDIGFYPPSHDNTTKEEFDGVGGVLGLAFLPYDADLYFDNELPPSIRGDVDFEDAERWTINEKKDTVVIQVAVHEFGHALGLGHSEDLSAVMSPNYFGYEEDFKLQEDDIKGIQSLYGANPNNAPDLCQDASIDTITRTQDGSTYVFKGLWYWQIIDNKTADGYPRKISEDWEGLEGYLDAAFTEPVGNTYFFKGGRYWNFTNKEKNHDPKLISRGFEGIPDNLDAAFSLNEIGKTYVFKADEYWRYDKTSHPPVKPEYPKPITDFTGLPPESIDAAFVEVDNPVYFFTGDQYYLYDEETSTVPDADPPYPRPTAPDWFSCPNAER